MNMNTLLVVALLSKYRDEEENKLARARFLNLPMSPMARYFKEMEFREKLRNWEATKVKATLKNRDRGR